MRLLYENPSKMQREENYFNTFISIEKNFPKGKWEKSESPDFLLRTDTKKIIGLEVATLADEKMSEITKAQFKTFEIAESLAIQNNFPIMEVKAKFRNNSRIVDINDAANELIAIIKNRLPELNDKQTYCLNGFKGKYYSTIMVKFGTRNGRKWLSNYRFHHFRMNSDSLDPINRLQSKIDDKNKKINRYLKRCDECWLLIGVDEWNAAEAVNLTEEGTQHKYECSFTRLYFLRNIEGKLLRLNTRKSAIS